jgi:copper(I)-binding protein
MEVYRMKQLLPILALGLFLAGPSAAEPAAGIEISEAWARATPGQARNGAAYMVIENTADTADRLVSASSPVAERVELHAHTIVDGVARMREIEGIEVYPAEPVILQPGGLHLMLLGLTTPLQEGERFPVTLGFAEAGSVTAEVEIRRGMPGGGTHGHGSGHGSGHGPGPRN